MARTQSHTFGRIVFVLVCFVLLGLLLLAGFTPHEASLFDNEATLPFCDGWSVQLPDGSYQSTTLPARVQPGPDNIVRLRQILPDNLPTPAVLCLRSSHQTVRVSLDGAPLYAFGTERQPHAIGKSPGNIWNLVRLPAEHAGSLLEVELTSPYDMYAGRVNEIRVGSKAGHLFYIFKSRLPMLIATFLILCSGLGILLFRLFWTGKSEQSKGLMNLFACSVLASIWLFSESRLLQFFFDNQFFWICVTFISLQLLPAPVFRYLCQVPDYKDAPFMGLLVRVVEIQTCATCLLQFFGILDFIEVLPAISFLQISYGLACVISILQSWLRDHNTHMRLPALSIGLLYLLTIAEVIYIWLGGGLFTGMLLQAGMLVLIVILGAHAFNEARRMAELGRLAGVDAQTGCLNRTAYSQRMAKLKSDPRAAARTAVAMFDLNDLKTINDTRGHAAGDAALARCAKCLLQAYGAAGSCYRVGGDEFLFLGEGMTDEQLAQCAKTFATLCAGESQDLPFDLAVACGYTRFNSARDHGIMDTINRADRFMYRHKHRLKQTSDARTSIRDSHSASFRF